MNQPRRTSVDVAILGGGIIGTAAALELARNGASVALCEASAIGAGASGRNSGSVQHPFDPVLASLHRATLDAYGRLAAETADRADAFVFPDRPAGLLVVAPEAEAAALEVERAAMVAAAPELAPTILSAVQLLRLEPSLAPDLVAIRLETARPVPPAAAVRAFARLAAKAGATLEIGQAARLERRGEVVVGLRREDGRTVPAGAVLVATGPWTAEVLDPGGRWRPIVRTWGVTVATRLEAAPDHVLEQSGVGDVNRPEGPEGGRTGRQSPSAASRPPIREPEGHFPSSFSLVTAGGVSVVGSTFLPDEPDPGSVGPLLLHRADRFVPGLHRAGVDELRACARPQSLDGRPLVGRVPDHENLFICAGHGPWGISTGPETARLVAELILGHGANIPPELDPARFA